MPEMMRSPDTLIEVYLGVNTTIPVNRYNYQNNNAYACQFETYLGLGVTSIGWDL